MSKLIMLTDEVIINIDEISNVTFNKELFRGTNSIVKYIEFLKYKETYFYGQVMSSHEKLINNISTCTNIFTMDQFAEFVSTNESPVVLPNYVKAIESIKMEIVLKNGFIHTCRYFDIEGDILFNEKYDSLRFISNNDKMSENKRYSRIKKIIIDNAV